MEEKFYIIKPAVDTEETGHVYPAVVSFDDYDFKGPNSVHKLKFGEFPDFIPDIRFKLAKGAKLCDVMGQATISAHGLLISNHFKLRLEKLNLPPHKFFPAFISDSNNINHNYYWFQIVWEKNTDFIDWSNSKFIIKYFSKIEGKVQLFSYNEYIIKSKQLGSLKNIIPTNLKLYKIPFDIFNLSVNVNLIANNNSVEFLMNKITGISISEIEIIFHSKDLDQDD